MIEAGKYHDISYKKDGNVAIISLDRPKGNVHCVFSSFTILPAVFNSSKRCFSSNDPRT